jgi:phage tail-like protein
VRVGAVTSAVNSIFGQVGLAHRFCVVVDHSQFALGDWEKASGLSVSWESCTHRVGDMGNDFLMYPGLTKYENIKLTRAACGDSQTVQDWLAETAKSPQPLTGAIALVDWLGMPIVQWKLKEFIPVGWSIVDFDTGGGTVARETLQLAHTGFLQDDVAQPSAGGRSLAGW